ncbi:MAG: sulfatase [Phycisphaerae bacterium]
MLRHLFQTAAILLLAAAGLPGAVPNVLLIVSDDHQHSAMGCAGNPIVRTPHLDRLAAEGVRFSHAFISIPICTPSRAAFLTGRYGAHNGVTFFGHKMRPEVPTLAQVLTRSGFQTAFTGKWHNDGRPGHHGFTWTGNVFPGGMCDFTDPRLCQGLADKPQVVPGNITELFTEAAVRFLETRDASRPFFLNVAYTAPHDPRTPPPAYESMYYAMKIPLPGNFMPEPRFDPGTLSIRDEMLLPLPRDPEIITREMARYYGLITHMDTQIGRILDALDRRGLTDNTIVFFAGDNGLALGAHALLGKQTLHDEGTRVPLIIRHPRLGQRGQVRDSLVDLIDLMPTACEWTETGRPEELDGFSLADVYTGRITQVRDAVFARYDDLFRSIRTSRHKLIQYLKLGREELFDVAADPLELQDLSADASLSGTRDQLRRQLQQWRAVQHDTSGLRGP